MLVCQIDCDIYAVRKVQFLMECYELKKSMCQKHKIEQYSLKQDEKNST